MTPDFDTRLKSIASAMENIVIPAIAPDDTLPLQQAGLIVGHIALMRQQLPHLQAFERLCLQDMEQTARRLCALSSSPTAPEARKALEAALADGVLAAQARYIAIGRAIEDMIAAAQSASSPQLLIDLSDHVLDFSERQTLRERVWFAGAGFDAQVGSLPSIATLLANGASVEA